MTNCFEVRIGFMAFLLAVSIGMLWNIAYGSFANHGFHSQDLMRTSEILLQQCQSQIKLQDKSVIEPCKNFFQSLDKHLTAAFNESATDVNAIKSTIGGELVIK